MLDLEQIHLIGRGLKRPECVLCTAYECVHASNWDGGVSVLESDGGQISLVANVEATELKPNGICLLNGGSYLLAHLGSNAKVSDGYIVLVSDKQARIVADGLGYTDECVAHPDGRRLYVNETFSRRLSSFEISADGSLSNRGTVTEVGVGTYPDGLVFDAESTAWIMSIVSNRVPRVSESGEQAFVVEDSDPEPAAWVEEAFLSGSMARPHLDQVRSQKLRNISSLPFGGADLRTAYLGCLLGDSIATFRSPVPGLPPPHWNVVRAACP